MHRKYVQQALSLYFAISCLLMFLCLVIVIIDSISMAQTGEFELLPILNVVQFKGNVPFDRQMENLDQARAYIEELYRNGYGQNDPLWRFINATTTIAMVNNLLYHVLLFTDLHIKRYTFILIWFACIIALMLIITERIYVRDCFGASEIKFRFPIAYISWDKVTIPALLFMGFACHKKLSGLK